MSELSDQDGWKGGGSNDPSPWGRIEARMRAMQDRIEKLERGAPLATAGIHVAPEGMTIDSSLTILGDLAVPNGSIDNEALANPLVMGRRFANAEGPFNLVAAEQTMATTSITLPDGFTNATVLAWGDIGVTNPMALDSSLAARVYIEVPATGVNTWGARRFAHAEQGSSVVASSQWTTVLTNLPAGAVIQARVISMTNANWSAPANGGASIAALFFFSR